MGIETLNSYTTTGIIIAATGSYNTPFTVTTAGEIKTGDSYAIDASINADLTNSGTIDATGANYIAVYFSAGGSVTNSGASALISGGEDGLYVTHEAGTVMNSGTITGPGGFGVFLGAGGTVSNSGLSAVIYGGSYGVLTQGGVANVSNAATINAQYTGVGFNDDGSLTNTGTITGRKEDGVNLEAGSTVINSVTAGVILGGRYGVFSQGGASTIFNYGTITGTTTTSTLGIGIELLSGGTITNNGTAALITGGKDAIVTKTDAADVNNYGTIFTAKNFGVYMGAGGTVTNTGTAALISGGEGGVSIRVHTGDVTNTGTITGTTSVGTGVYLGGGGTIANTGTSADIFGDVIAVAVKAGAGTVANAGTITGKVSFGVYLQDGGIVTNTGTASVIFGAKDGVVSESAGIATIINSGTITGTTVYGIHLAGGGTVTNSGTIAGKVAVKFGGSGANRLVAEGGAVFTGAVEGVGTQNTLELAGTGSTVASIGGQFSGFQTIAFDPGADWSISGTSLSLADGQTITGFANSDTIDLTGIQATAATFVNGLLTLVNGATPLATLTLPESAGIDTNNFSIQSDNNGGTEIAVFLCYLRGTRILTPTGEKPIETLNIGDLVITRFGGFRPIKWIGRQTFDNTVVSLTGQHKPVKIAAGALGPNQPARDLFVSPGHSMLIDNTLVLAETLINGITITQDEAPDLVEYYQLDLGTHDCIIAEGTWSESFADGPDGSMYGLRGTFHNVDEFYRLYPDQPPAAELTLCAPRPLSGPALEAVLTPVINRANATPGKLDGCVDVVTAGWYIEGWALDTANPNLPVHLDIYLGDRLLGTTLACNHRPDLQKAGKGSGRCAFRFTAPVKLSPEAQASLRVQRHTDCTPLRLSKTLSPLRFAS